MNYKELIEELRSDHYGGPKFEELAVTAIENLLAERDALESDLLAFRTCSTCANAEENSADGRPCDVGGVCTGQYWKWRGPQREEKPHGN